ncbi:cupin domain-containing protein [Pseudomaricurvus alkylphenolicus]|jgi:uncharacterized cupin superfamily protein|uniref:cupin domain-containing protein n=1 Tax=Pseudomaricurvus alkylphenolicus TaxID=1306991 RepID=UPI003B832158
MKPLLNLNDIRDFQHHRKGPFNASFAAISETIGAQKLGYSLTVLEPGFKVCPFHNHRVNEEMFLILEGEGTLRFGVQQYPLKPLDIIACPPGGREVAHQIINTGDHTLKYLSLSTNEPVDICEYPDSDKIYSFIGQPGQREFGHLTRAADAVDYFDGELEQ